MSERSVMLWAAIVAGSCILAVGGIFGFITLPALRFIWREENAALSWAALVVNTIAQFIAVWIIHALLRRSTGARAQILRMAFLFALGYAAVAFLVTAYAAAATPLAVFVSNGANIGSEWPIVVASLIIPVAIAAFVLTFVPRGEHAAQS